MKQIIIIILAAVLISLAIPLAIVELVPPGENAASTAPHTTEMPAVDAGAELM